MSAELNKIDRIIKNRLSDGGTLDSTPDWERMQRALDEATETGAQEKLPSEESLFDDAIKAALPLEVGAVKGWERLEHSLNELQVSTTETFDELVSQKINNGHLSGTSSWSKLDNLLNEYENWRTKVISSRVIEATLLFLFLFILFQYGDQFSISPPVVDQTKQSSTETELGSLDTEAITSLNNNSESLDSKAIENSSAAESLDKPNNGSEKTVDKIYSTQAHSINRSQEDLIEKVSDSQLKNGYSVNSNSHPAESTHSDPSIAIDHSAANNYDKDQESTTPYGTPKYLDSNKLYRDSPLTGSFIINDSELSPTGTVNSLERIQSLHHELSWTISDLENTIPNITPISVDKETTGWSYAYHIDTDVTKVISEPDFAIASSRYRRYAIGNGIGFRVNRDMGRLHLESGVSFHYLSYEPRSVVFIQSGSYDTEFNGIGVTSIRRYTALIPLDFQYNLLNNDDFRFYVIGGVNAHLNIKSTYDLNNIVVTRNPEPQEGLMLQALEPAQLSMAPNEIGQAEYESGITSSNTLTESSYFTLNLGAGVDYKLSERIAFYASYTYRHRVIQKDFGPYRDRFRIGTVSTGVRVHLFD